MSENTPLPAPMPAPVPEAVAPSTPAPAPAPVSEPVAQPVAEQPAPVTPTSNHTPTTVRHVIGKKDHRQLTVEYEGVEYQIRLAPTIGYMRHLREYLKANNVDSAKDLTEEQALELVFMFLNYQCPPALSEHLEQSMADTEEFAEMFAAWIQAQNAQGEDLGE